MCTWPNVLHTTGVYPGFRSMKRQGVLLSGWNASPSHCKLTPSSILSGFPNSLLGVTGPRTLHNNSRLLNPDSNVQPLSHHACHSGFCSMTKLHCMLLPTKRCNPYKAHHRLPWAAAYLSCQFAGTQQGVKCNNATHN